MILKLEIDTGKDTLLLILFRKYLILIEKGYGEMSF